MRDEIFGKRTATFPLNNAILVKRAFKSSTASILYVCPLFPSNLPNNLIDPTILYYGPISRERILGERWSSTDRKKTRTWIDGFDRWPRDATPPQKNLFICDERNPGNSISDKKLVSSHRKGTFAATRERDDRGGDDRNVTARGHLVQTNVW